MFGELKQFVYPNLSCKLFLFYCPLYVGHVAQLVEQLTFNQLVEGSNPSVPTLHFSNAILLALVYEWQNSVLNNRKDPD